jgi:endonuclease YncB( thermonuclease family)
MLKMHALAVLAAMVSVPVQANILTGPATVIDGDTIDMTGTRIRIVGIDAPESAQSCTRDGQAWACGTEATATLREIIASAPITCTALGTDIYGRTLATCETAVFDVGREMVRRGMALASADAPSGYDEATAIARQLKYGIWVGEFQQPAEWRAANPRSDQAARIARQDDVGAAPARRSAATISDRRYTNAFGCAIKGNRSRRGEWIYHLPGQEYYEDTRPEDLFCTEREAQAAGYRRAKA